MYVLSQSRGDEIKGRERVPGMLACTVCDQDSALGDHRCDRSTEGVIFWMWMGGVRLTSSVRHVAPVVSFKEEPWQVGTSLWAMGFGFLAMMIWHFSEPLGFKLRIA